MQIEPPIELYPQRPNPFARLPLYIAFLILSGALIFGLLMLIPVPQTVFKITRAEGLEILPQGQKLWRLANTGEEIHAGDRIRTYQIGWADLATQNAALKIIGNSEIEISRLYLWDQRRPQLHLIRGYFYAAAETPGMEITVGQIAPEIIQSPLFTAMTLSTTQGKCAVGFTPSIGSAQIYTLEKSLHLKSWFPWREILLPEKQTAEIFIHPFSSEITKLSESEIARLQNGFKTIALTSTLPQPEKPAQKVKPMTPPAAKSGGLNAWDLNSFSLYKTKSSTAEWSQGKFQYEVPGPESIAGVTFHHKEINASPFQFINLQIQPIENLTYPEVLRIEIKSGDRVLRVLTTPLSGIASDKGIRFPIRFTAANPLTEISLIVTHAKAGTSKKGGFHVMDLSFT